MVDNFNYDECDIYCYNITQSDATIVCCPRTPIYVRHIVDGRVLNGNSMRIKHIEHRHRYMLSMLLKQYVIILSIEIFHCALKQKYRSHSDFKDRLIQQNVF